MRGRPVVINFFASWCAPCKAEGAAFADAADAYHGRVQFVGVAIDDSRAGALSYTHHYNGTGRSCSTPTTISSSRSA